MIITELSVAAVATVFLDKCIENLSCWLLRFLFFPKQKYKEALINIIYKTIEEYKLRHPYLQQHDSKFHFYDSQILFEEMNNFMLFETNLSTNEILERFEENPNIIIPTEEELYSFYSLFVNNINKDKHIKKIFMGENYKAKIFQIGEALEGLDKKIKDIEKKLIFEPSCEWFVKQNLLSIKDLGIRYNPDVNFELNDSILFEALGRTNKFKDEVEKNVDIFFILGKKVLSIGSNITYINNLNKNLETIFKEIFDEWETVNLQDTKRIPVENILELVDKTRDIVEKIEDYYLETESKIKEIKKSHSSKYNKFGHEIRITHDFLNEQRFFSDFIRNTFFQLASKPILVIYGEAGIGKSHILGDIVNKRINEGYESIFILGQQLLSNENPWTQIFDILQINTNSEEFLATLNERGKIKNKRIVLFIDAINEGRGKYFWPEFIRSFITDIESYEWLGLVLTVRSPYKKLIFGDDVSEKFISHELHGFRDIEHIASEFFFDYYEIELPNTPLLHPEFQNPLFLRLFCEGIKKSGSTRAPEGIQGITSIINFFLDSVNNTLSKPNHLDYPNSINLVQKISNALIAFKAENDISYIPYETAYALVSDEVSKYIDKKDFIENLISEGVLTKNLFWKSDKENQEVVYFTFERFEDHLISQYLLEKYPDTREEFKKGGGLNKYIRNEESIYRNRGLIDAFSIQIPEKLGSELFEFIPSLKSEYAIIESFIKSLVWRKKDSMDEKLLPYINDYVFSFQGTYELFLETILSIATLPGHFFNSKLLHNNLLELSMEDRDAEWTVFLNTRFYDGSSVKRLIDWAWKEGSKSYVSDESIELASITLAWFHTSTNRKLRDHSTKALICLLQDRINVLISVLKRFEGVNDPYIYERLFAVAYGCVLRSNQKDYFAELSEYVFEVIFNVEDEVYPHVLLRDYARQIIEYTCYLGYSLSFDLKLVRPPYKSFFPKKIISDEEIVEKYKFDYKNDSLPEYYWSQNDILNSMATQSGRKAGSYGDFGRYVFEDALHSWDVNVKDLSNLAIEWIFVKYRYNVEKHGRHDRKIYRHEMNDQLVERIGKKYQWIALHEMVARVSDNFKKYEEYSFRKENEEPYQGPWSPYLRDIDPTLQIYKTGYKGIGETIKEKFWWRTPGHFDWEASNKEWIKDSTDLPEFKNLIEVEDEENEKWLVLECHPDWREPKRIGDERWSHPYKRFWTQVRSYIVSEENFKALIDWAELQNFYGRWMPERSNRYQVFNREFFWSPAYKHFATEYYNGHEWHEIIDPKTNQHIAKAIVSTESFLWEAEFDRSKEDAIFFLKPCAKIYRDMNIKHSSREGEFINNNGEIICFDASVNFNSEPHLLIRKTHFMKYLNENKLKIIWTVLGEKQVSGGREDYHGKFTVNGVYYFKNDKVVGEIDINKSEI